jgi:hypothetical protein
MTETTELDPTYVAERDEARRLLVEAIELKGADYVYPKNYDGMGATCLYQNYDLIREGDDGGTRYERPTGPSCIVGHVLIAKGVDPIELAAREGDSALDVAQLEFVDPVVLDALDAAQAAQDGGQTWGEALARFDDHIALYESFKKGD